MVRQHLAHRDALDAAQASSVEDNLAYLQANIGYFLNLDTGQCRQRLAEIQATMSVVVDQLKISTTRSRGLQPGSLLPVSFSPELPLGGSMESC